MVHSDILALPIGFSDTTRPWGASQEENSENCENSDLKETKTNNKIDLNVSDILEN